MYIFIYTFLLIFVMFSLLLKPEDTLIFSNYKNIVKVIVSKIFITMAEQSKKRSMTTGDET